jgi:hypothetical protein
MSSLLVTYEIPKICLILWSDPALFVVSYEWIKLTVEEYHDDVCVGSLCKRKVQSIPFDLLTFDSSSETADVNVTDYRRLVASILGSLAQEGMLTESVDRFGVRSSAIAALAATGLVGNEVMDDKDGEALVMSSQMLSRSMQCLVELCTVETEAALHHREVTLSESKAEVKLRVMIISWTLPTWRCFVLWYSMIRHFRFYGPLTVCMPLPHCVSRRNLGY